MTVQQLVEPAQRAAAGTEQAGRFVEEADRVDMVLPGVKEEEQEESARAQQATPGQDGVGRARCPHRAVGGR